MPDRPDIPEEAVKAALSDAKVVADSVFGRIVVRAIEVAASVLLKEEEYRAEREMERADEAEVERDQALAKGAEVARLEFSDKILRLEEELGASQRAANGARREGAEEERERVKEALLDQVERIRHRERNCRFAPPIRETRAEKAGRLGRAWGLDNAAAGLEGFVNARFPAPAHTEEKGEGRG